MQKSNLLNLRKLWLSLLLLVGATAIAVPGIQEVMDGDEPVAKIGNTEYATLQAAFNAAQDGQTVTLLHDYNASSEAMAGGTRQFVIKKSITFDGGGFTLTTMQRGIGIGNVNGDISSNIDVTIKNITINNTSSGARCIDTRGYIGSLTLDGVTLNTQDAPLSDYNQPLTIGGSQSDAATVNITNSTIQTNNAGTAYYAITTFNPVKMNITGSTIKGWACIYAKGANSSVGSAGSEFNINNSTLVSSNAYSGVSNSFGAFVMEDDNVTINVTNTGITLNNSGDQIQSIASFKGHSGTVNLGEGNNIEFVEPGGFSFATNGTNADFNITGGTFNADPSAYLADGYKAVNNGNDTWTVQEKTYVAQIGETKYETLAETVTAAQQMGGAVTVEIINDISGETVTIKEVANFQLTIDGKKDDSSNYTVDATIVVDGLRGNGGDTDNGASVTLQNISFVKTTSTNGIEPKHYPHHLTVQDCTYTGFDNDKWFLYAKEDCPLYGVTVKNVTVEHARLIYANLGDNAVFENIIATNDIKVGFNDIKTGGTVLIKNCQVTTAKYAFRDAPEAYVGTITLEDNTLISTSEESDEGVIVNRGGAVGTAHMNVESGTYTGHVKVLNNKEGVLAISGGYFSEEFPQEYIAADLVSQGKVCVPATDKEGFYTIGDPHYVAQIGETGYVSLQAAADAAHEMTGDVTITLLEDISEYAVIHQKAGLNLTIDGADKTVAGQIFIDGNGRASGTETLTIKNIKFEGNTSNFYSGTDAFILVPSTKDTDKPWSTGAYNYAHNITVTDCSFTSTSTSSVYDVVCIKATSAAGAYNVVINNCTASGTMMHSLAQFTGTTGGSVTNCTVTGSESFVNVSGGTGDFNISGNTFTSDENASEGYGIRENGSSTAVITLTDNTFTAANAVLLGKTTAVTAGTINVESGVYTGAISKTEAATGKIAISGGYFSEEFPQEYIAADLVAQGKVCTPATDMEGFYTIGDPHYVAQIGETKYVSLSAAVEAVPAGTETTIVMIDDDIINSNAGVTIPAEKNIVLDLNGKTIKGVVQSPANAQTILNKGTLTITDSSDEKNGTITNEVSDENAGSPGNNKNWFSNTISNTGTLTVNDGKIINTGTGGACYAIDNQTNANLQTPVLNIAGGNISAVKVAVRMFCNSTTNDNTVNMTGGTVSGGVRGIQTQIANANANKATLIISGGYINGGDYAWLDTGYNQNNPNQYDNVSYSITGGFFTGDMWSYATYYRRMDGFISGGLFSTAVGGDLVKPGSACVDNTDEATKVNYPYAIGLADVHYYWLDNSGNIDGGGYYTIYAPFAGPDPVLMDGEFVVLQKNITLTKDIEYIEEVSFGNPIYKGGTFTLTFGEYNIDLNGHVFPIPAGVTVLTDKRTNIFSALEEGYGVVETATETGYSYTVAPYVAQIGDTKYVTLTAAVAAAQSGETIELLADITNETGNKSLKAGVTLDGKGKTISGDIAIYISKDGGTVQNVNFKNIHNASNKKSAIYSEYLEGTATITGCTFDNCDWDALQILPKEGSNVVITNNTFSDDQEDGITQKRYIHVQSAENVDFSATITENVMLGNNGGPMDIYYPTDKSKLNLTNNYIEVVDDNLCILLANDDGFAGELAFPAYTTAEKEETYSPEAYVLNNQYSAKFYMTFAEAVTAAGNDKVVSLVTKVTDPYVMSEGQTLKVKKNGKSITVNGPAGFAVTSTTTNGVTTYTLVEASVKYTATNGTVTYSNVLGSTGNLANGTYTLLKDITMTSYVLAGLGATNITLDLNGHNLTNTGYRSGYPGIVLLGRGNTTFNIINSGEGGGVMSAPDERFEYLVSMNSKNNTLNIGTGVTINGCVAVFKDGNTLNVEGTINGGGDFAVCTNGSGTTNATININDGAVLTSDVTAMYLPGDQNVTISGGTITGATGIYVKSGTLNITGGEINGTGAAAEYTYNGNGCNATGDALVVENCGYPSGAPTVNVTGGTFTSTNADAIASYNYGENEPIADFVHGGYFNTELSRDICEEGKKTVPSTVKEGYYELGDIVYVAKIGETQYETLEEAWNAVNDGETITLLADCAGNGIKAPQGKFTNGVTIDFDGHTYTMDGTTVGSTGTETQAFQLLKDNKITFKNGTITSSVAKMLVQNYSNLTLEGMTLTLNNPNYAPAYTLSNNNGNVVIDGTTINANPAGGFAFDVCRYSSYPSVNVTVTGNSVINGDVEVSASGSNAKDGFNLMFEGGTLNGEIVLDETAKTAMANTPDKAKVSKSNALTDIAAPEDYDWVDNGDGTSYLALTEEIEMILIDGKPYPVSKTATYKKVTYRRTFNKNHKKNLQAWYVPFNYTITADDEANFQFYKIHMIANSKEAGTVTSQEYIYIYIEPLATGYELKANVPYLVRPLNILTDHDFVMENIVLNAPKTTSTKHLETSEHKYDFYGCYNEYKPSYTGECYWMSASGLLTPGSSDYSLKSYRWYLKQTVNDFNVDAKATFVFVESEDGEATGINGTSLESSDDIEGVYSSNGIKLDTPQKGMNIIRYKNGKTKKIMVK